MSEREIVQKIKDDGYNCNHTGTECKICPLCGINNNCGKSLNAKATHEQHLSRIKLVDEYLAQPNVLEHSLAIINDMFDAFNKYHEKKELEFIVEKNRIDLEVSNRPRKFTTLDGVDVISGVDKCYCINVVDKFYPINNRKRVWGKDDFTNPKFKFFDDKQKADCYLALLKGEPVEWYFENKWINVVTTTSHRYINLLDWVKYEYRLKTEDKFAELKEAHKNGAIIQVEAMGRWYDTTYNKPNWDVNSNFRIKPIEDPFAELKEAHKNGASIQYRSKLSNVWDDSSRPNWCDNIEYRIKPEPMYQPYTKPNYDICGAVIKDKEKNNNHYVISVVSDDNKYFLLGSFKTANELFTKYVTKNGKPLGEEIK